MIDEEIQPPKHILNATISVYRGVTSTAATNSTGMERLRDCLRRETTAVASEICSTREHAAELDSIIRRIFDWRFIAANDQRARQLKVSDRAVNQRAGASCPRIRTRPADSDTLEGQGSVAVGIAHDKSSVGSEHPQPSPLNTKFLKTPR